MSLVDFMFIIFTCMPNGATVGDSQISSLLMCPLSVERCSWPLFAGSADLQELV